MRFRKGNGMKAKAIQLVITLDEDDISALNDIVLFALDLHAERIKNGECCMFEHELKLAKELADLTEKLR
jgi:hypothetical protein